MNELRLLQCRHRVEEVVARFGLRVVEVGSGIGHLGFASLAKVRVEGVGLTPGSARARAEAAGLTCDEDGVRLPYDAAPEVLEDALLEFLGGLLEEDPEPFLQMPRRQVEIPRSGALPQSAEWLERFYGGDFLPREKKPAVIDLRRCNGPYLRSVDDEPLQIVDAASQIASVAAGFRPSAAQAALDEGLFDPYLVAAPSADSPLGRPVADAFREALRSAAGSGLPHVCFTNGGSEANEKALHLARMYGPGGRRVIAFEGSFHGRTLLPLFSTWNPVKRAPYQIPGYETAFVPFPGLGDDPYADPLLEPGWRAAWESPEGKRDFEGDALLTREVESLRAVEAEIRAGEVLAVIIEPYQCEGGDRGATRRFFNGLRALTRAYDVPLIFDEVQSGFGLSGPVFWHRRFMLMDSKGRPDAPELVTGAKRAQVGYVLSRWPDPEPTHGHVASMLRGRLHLEIVRERPGHEAHTRRRLEALAGRWEGVVGNPRVFGDAFAFDMPSKAAANHLINQRFYRGYMVYIAGERTLRYRMNRSMSLADIDVVFEVIEGSLEALVAQAGGREPEKLEGVEAPAWDPPPARPERSGPRFPVRIRAITGECFDEVADEVEALEEEVYELERRDSVTYFRTLAHADGAICLLAEDDSGLVGMAFGAPIELWPETDGPAQDPHRGLWDTLYSADLTVSPRAQGKGVGYQLRLAFLREALRVRREDGRPRYAFVSGRNQWGAADPMWVLNQRFGAYEVARYAGQYERVDGITRYYRIPLRRHDRRPFRPVTPRTSDLETTHEMGEGINLPTGRSHPLLERARDLGVFDEAAFTKLTVSNFITAPYARYAEYLRHIAPRGNPHLYFTSSLDEMVDKSLRALKQKRTAAHLAVGVEGGYVGHTTAASRSITDGDEGYFDWPKVPHPGSDPAACVAALDALVEAHGADALLGVYIETVQARTGAVLEDEAWAALCAWRDRTGVPLVLSETTTGLYRAGRDTFWWVDSVPGDADLVLWWAGGQIGHVFSSDDAYVEKPLTLISTWDGDELSATRLLWQMYACEGAPVAERAAQLEGILVDAGLGEALGGAGLYRTLDLGTEYAARLQRSLDQHGVRVQRPLPHLLVVAPPITIGEPALHSFAWALRRAMQ